MKNYEVTFIVDPVLSGDEIKATAKTYADHLTKEGCKIVANNEMGLRQLAYPINKRTTGIYNCIEFESETGALVNKLELAFRRDERIMRFLVVRLDKYGVKYNEDKRNGLIGSKKKKAAPEDAKDAPAKSAKSKPAPKPVAKPAAKPAPKPATETAPAAVATPTAEEEE